MSDMLDRHDMRRLLILVTIVIVVCIALIVLLGGCSTNAGRFDHRPAICKDLGKRGSEC